MVGVGAHPQPETTNAEVTALVRQLAKVVSAQSPAKAIDLAQKVQRVFEGIELTKTAEHRRNGASDRDTRRRATAGGTRSAKAAARATKRAEAVEVNPALAGDVSEGLLGEEQLDAIAGAAAKTGGDAAKDASLINEIKTSPVDQASKIANRWVERRDDSTESRHERQRARRALRFGYDKATGCESMTALADRASIEELRRAVTSRADELYQADGGRDVPPVQHPRTHAQRMFDALHQLLTGDFGAATSGETPDGHRTSSGVRTMLHVSITVDDDEAHTIRAATIGGAGYLPQSVLERYGCNSMICGTVFSQQGEVLWHGRQKRHATAAQISALIARDGGCVVCGADPSRCQAHHVIPWSSPGRGKTDIDGMALVCADHHQWVHEQHLTLYWQLGPPDANGTRKRTWSTRPAKPNEIARSTPTFRKRAQFDANSMASRSNEPSGSKPADARLSVKAT